MKLALAAVEEVEYFRSKAEDIKDTSEEAYLVDVAEVDLAVAMEEEETIGAVEKMLKWCNIITYHNWRFTFHMTSLTMNGTGYLSQKE